MGDNSFKPPKLRQSSGEIGLSKSASSHADGYDYPVFCFKYLHKEYDIDKCCIKSDKKFLRGFVKKLKLLSDLTWSSIKLSDRTGHGAEKIAKNSIKVSIPASITNDVEEFLSFYFAGDKGRIIGFQDSNIFHVVYIDTDLSVYNHA